MENTSKPQDEAQKWRAFKNISRFFKNPFGYVYWKMEPFHHQNRVRFVWLLLTYHLYFSGIQYMLVKNQKEKMCAHYRYRVGDTNDFHGPAHSDRRFPANRHKNYLRYSNFHQARRNKRLGMIYTNWWCRDQNFRKYFEMRKKNDMRPSETGFYHEKIYEDAARQNAAVLAQRYSRQAK